MMKQKLLALALTVLLLSACGGDSERTVWHVTCLDGIYEGDVYGGGSFTGYEDVSTGKTIYLPRESCVFVEAE